MRSDSEPGNPELIHSPANQNGVGYLCPPERRPAQWGSTDGYQDTATSPLLQIEDLLSNTEWIGPLLGARSRVGRKLGPKTEANVSCTRWILLCVNPKFSLHEGTTIHDYGIAGELPRRHLISIKLKPSTIDLSHGKL